MQDLKLVGVHDDGEHLVLATPDGQKYLLVVDDPLRAAVRLDRARLSQLQISHENRLRPRDIQARIRAGQTAEQIAESADVPVEFVRRFEGPVLAEREFVVRQAQAVRIRHAKGPASTLGEVVNERLSTRDVEEDDQVWDARRGDDGVWMVTLTFEAGNRRREARWAYDAQLRHVTPQDDESRWLTDDSVEEPGTRHPRLATVGGTTRRDALGDSLVRDRVYDIEADGGVRPGADARPAAVGNATVDLLDSLRERRGRRQRVTDPELAGGTLGVDPLDAALHGGPVGRPAPTGPPGQPGHGQPGHNQPAHGQPGQSGHNGHSRTERAEPPAPAPAPAPAARYEPEPDLVVLPEVDVTAPLPPVEPEPAAAPAEDPAAQSVDVTTTTTERPASRRARRASVPKWDDIVFGSRRE